MIRWLACVLLFIQPMFGQTEFSQENATEMLKHLCIKIGPRPMGSPAEHIALEFAASKFKEYGCDTSYIMPMDHSSRANTTSGIAVGIKRGKTNRIIVIGGHIDSAGPEIPGADDDGSGAATVIELARVFGYRSMQSTLVFCCFGGEEQGLEGSKHFASYFPELDSVALMLQVDMANGLGVLDIDPDVHGQSAPKWLVRAAVEEFYNLGYENLRYPTHFFSMNYAGPAGSGSDHEPFLERGIPAIDFSTDVSKPIHTPRDNFENFDPRGLKRTGDLVAKLAVRFDGGTPNRVNEEYWLYLIGSTPIFIPLWGITVFALLSLILAIVAFIAVRARREFPDPSDAIQWKPWMYPLFWLVYIIAVIHRYKYQLPKMFLFSLIIVVCGYFSSDLIGLLRGVRHPWFTSIDFYIVLAAIAMFIGTWIVVQMSRKLRMSDCPYAYFSRAVIMLAVFLILFWPVSTKLTIEPAVALLFISLAMLVRQPALKFLFAAISPLWMLRLIFSEWDELLFRSFALGNLPSFVSTIILPLLFTLYILPFVFAFAAVFKDSERLQSILNNMRASSTLVILLIAFVSLGGYLLIRPTYNALWYRDVKVEENYDMNNDSTDVTIQSSEFLSGLTVSHEGIDTTMNARTTSVHIDPHNGFNTTWLNVQRFQQKYPSGDTMAHYDIALTLTTLFRPYTVDVTYSSEERNLRAFSTDYKFRTTKEGKKIEWYSFPDTVLHIPVSFPVIGNDSVKETIVVTFDSLAYPMKLNGEKMYFLPRTKYTQTWVYRK
jgi:hypothetical protein